ncbi:hypothetical protein ACFYP4_02255 [Streptomyces sp. NPDC005551]|uniref:hypothetical protein n=1 Tax=Streptomyces sp. NPDC005551 TaxID=3364725 RepID=UPI0036C7666E
MNDTMDAAMREAVNNASRTRHGYLVDVPKPTLQKLEAAGLAIRDEDETEHHLTEEGFTVSRAPSLMTSTGIGYHVSDRSRWEIPVILTSPVEDVSTYSGGTVRPHSVTISLVPNRAGWWCLSHAAVWGPKVKDGKVTTKRDYSILFTDLGGVDGEMPDWLHEICQYWEDRANGGSRPTPQQESEPTLTDFSREVGEYLDKRLRELLARRSNVEELTHTLEYLQDKS